MSALALAPENKVIIGLEDGDWDTLVDEINHGRCGLVLGPRAAQHPDQLDGPFLSTLLARHLAQSMPSAPGGTPDSDLETFVRESEDLTAIAEMFIHRAGKKTPKLKLRAKVREFYDKITERTTPLHELLARIPFSLCIDATHDRFLQNALVKRQGPQNFKLVPDFYHYNLHESGNDPAPADVSARPSIDSEQELRLYNLFGSLAAPESLVLSESDLLDFLVKVTRESPAIDGAVLKEIRSCSTFLFLGFEFHRWYARVLWHVLSSQSGRASRETQLIADRFPAAQTDPTGVYFQCNSSFTFFDQAPQAFVKELDLRGGWSQWESPATTSLAKPDGPTVFICHDSDDKDAVRAIRKYLVDNSITPWVDENELLVGDMFDNAIQAVIPKMDYFLLLATPKMLSRRQKYCIKEIDIAMEIQRGVAADCKFILPVLYDSAGIQPGELEGLRPNLSKLHASRVATVNDSAGMNAIVEAINRDWRKKRPK